MESRTAPGRGGRASYAAYRAGGAVATRLPASLAAHLATGAGRVLWTAMRGRRAMVARHMQRVQGPGFTGRPLRQAVRAVFDSYARYWLEAFRLPVETPATIMGRIRGEGIEHLEAAHAAGRGVVLAAPHLGGWDFGGAWLALLGFKPLAVAEVLEPPELFEWFSSWRRAIGIEIVAADADAGTAVLEGIRRGRTVGLVADRDILGSGVEVDFFGERTTLPAGPAVLALRTGAPLIPAAVYFEGRHGHVGVLRPPLDVTRQGRFRADVQRITQALAGELEGLIRRAPEQWHLMQPNWPSDPGWAHERAGWP